MTFYEKENSDKNLRVLIAKLTSNIEEKILNN